MKKFKDFIQENYDVYLDTPHTKKYKANIIMTDKEGKEHHFPIGSNEESIRTAAHKTVKGLSSKGFKLKDVQYEF
jgi:hypothetical protein